MEVIGSITLNLTVGGLYPESVSKALALDNRIVWMPTHDANHHRRYFGDRCDGLSILADRESGGLRAEVKDIVSLVRGADAVLASGHLSSLETYRRAKYALTEGVSAVVDTPGVRRNQNVCCLAP